MDRHAGTNDFDRPRGSGSPGARSWPSSARMSPTRLVDAGPASGYVIHGDDDGPVLASPPSPLRTRLIGVAPWPALMWVDAWSDQAWMPDRFRNHVLTGVGVNVDALNRFLDGPDRPAVSLQLVVAVPAAVSFQLVCRSSSLCRSSSARCRSSLPVVPAWLCRSAPG